MELKKSYRADLEHRRWWFFLVGLLISGGLLALALIIPMSFGDDEPDADAFNDVVQDLELTLRRPQEDMIPYEIPKKKELDPQTRIKITEKTQQQSDLKKMRPQEEVETKEEKIGEEKTDKKEPPKLMNEEKPLSFRVVEQLPEFPGGASEFMKWLTRNLRYPSAAKQQKIQGRTVVTFIVNADGSTSDVKIAKSSHKILDREALRVIKLMPQWKPGENKGKPCRTMMAIPVVFAL